MSEAPEAVFNPVLPPGFEFNGEEAAPAAIRGSDRFITQAKTYVIENYNAHHDDELGIEDVYILWFAKVVSNWKALVASPQARGMIWMVTNNAPRQEVYIEIYKKLNNIKVNTRRTPKS